ncbi:MAG: DNA polymerase III subunit delta' [Geminicoccaceae bacterium]
MSETWPLPPRANPHLFGHAAAEEVFERAWRSGRLPHAWLLQGPPGIGKATLAYRLARRILAGPDMADPNDPASAIFRRVAHGSEPDLFVLANEVNRKTRRLREEIVISQARELTTKLHATAVGRHGRVVVVDATDDLNQSTVNALLKLIEEPPRGCVLLLVCHAPGRVPRTILSRCVRLRLAPLAPEPMRRVLATAGLVEGELSPALLALAQGSPGRYATFCDTGFLGQYAALLDALAAGRDDRGPLLEAADRLAGIGDAGVATDLLMLVLRRGTEAAGRGTLDPELAPGEAGRLAELTRGRRLDRWVGLWDKLRDLPGELDHLNFEPRQSFFLALAALAGAAEERLAG